MFKTGWIDSHAHIFSKEFNEDINQVIENAKENDIARIMVICSDLNEVEQALELSKKDKLFKVATGIHPCDQKTLTQSDWELFLKYAHDENIVAIGEIGLDYYWEKDNHKSQQELFIKQIELAEKLNKPIIVHSRDALQDTFDIMKNYKVKGVLHSYSGSIEMAKEFTKLGYYISLAGPVTFKNAVKPKEVATLVDIDKLLIETDCPYLTPVPFRGKRNEPMYVKHTGKYVAQLRNMDEKDLQKQLGVNYDNLFK